jgi:hypothetical protein
MLHRPEMEGCRACSAIALPLLDEAHAGLIPTLELEAQNVGLRLPANGKREREREEQEEEACLQSLECSKWGEALGMQMRDGGITFCRTCRRAATLAFHCSFCRCRSHCGDC